MLGNKSPWSFLVSFQTSQKRVYRFLRPLSVLWLTFPPITPLPSLKPDPFSPSRFSPSFMSHYETGSPTHPAWSMEQTQPHWWWQIHYPDCICRVPWCREGPHRARRWMSGMKLSGTHRSSQGDGYKFLLGLCCPCGSQWGPIIVSISLHENDKSIVSHI